MRLEAKFDKQGGVVITLRRQGTADDSKSGTWKVHSWHENSAVVAITVQSEGVKETKQLELQFQGKDQFTMHEIGGDRRVPPLVFSRSKNR